MRQHASSARPRAPPCAHLRACVQGFVPRRRGQCSDRSRLDLLAAASGPGRRSSRSDCWAAVPASMASKYHKMPKLQYRSTAGGGGSGGATTTGGTDESWVEAQAALKTLTPLSRVHLTLEDSRAEAGAEAAGAAGAAAAGGAASGAGAEAAEAGAAGASSAAASAVARYKLVVVDRRVKVRKKPLAAFIVPMGREHEWMFSSEEGQNQLTADAGFSRLAIVTMQRGQTYESLEQVKAELSPLVPQLMPDEPTPGSIPFLSLGDDIGSVAVVFTGTSTLSGDLFVEDVDGVDDEGTLRRLVFGSNRNLIQSEARLVAASPPVANPKDASIDQTYLSNQHHHSIVGAFSLLAERLMPSAKADHARAVSRCLCVPVRPLACSHAHRSHGPDTREFCMWCGHARSTAHRGPRWWLARNVSTRAFCDDGAGCCRAGWLHRHRGRAVVRFHEGSHAPSGARRRWH